MGERQKIGIFGGAFDPIHTGHLFLAEAARDNFGLDKVLFMPTPSPYHRTDKKVLPLEHRINMVRLAIEGNEHFEFSDFEIGLSGSTYTVNTLSAYKNEYPDHDLYLIIGGDTLFSIEKWKEPEKIFEMAVILSSKREGELKGESGSLGNAPGSSGSLPLSLHEEFLAKINELRERYGAQIYDISMPNLDISSSDISARIRSGRSVKYYVPDSVLKYIEENGLYRG